ncbi:hypothetical protein PVNG_02417 [Plasmodium vivax North Korean]|uniref:6-phosphofructokinase n=1 Tax=Plasmodium vivax North Korean TaxID=1035514 RepID=A0A0J9TLT2_PLAVI|nr:hypothetical protein PVNG_02417 [Plasmodium vivax North Korean]
MNSAIYTFSKLASQKHYKIVYIQNGYEGLIDEKYIEIDLEQLRKDVYLPGTVIGSSRSKRFQLSSEDREKGVKALKENLGVRALVILGGNGSYQGGELISKLGLPVILLPATIDNDVYSTKYTIGFHSALEEIGSALYKI